MEQKGKNTKNKRERAIGFMYVLLLFLTTTVACCYIMYYYADSKSNIDKEYIISKMERIKSLQVTQEQQVVLADSIYNKIRNFNLGINASYVENDIRFYLNNIKKFYDDNIHDERYKIFYQTYNFYSMWMSDKKELWSKNQNIAQFRKSLEECRIGLERQQNATTNPNR